MKSSIIIILMAWLARWAGAVPLPIRGDGSLLTNLNGSNIASGTVPLARLPYSYGGAGTSDANKLAAYNADGGLIAQTLHAEAAAGLYVGDGNFDASNLTDARAFVLPDADGTLALQGWVSGTFTGSANITTLGTIGTGTWQGSAIGAAYLPSESTLLDRISSTQGTVLYRDASGWSALAPGTSGQLLTTGGAAANPAWATYTGTSSITTLGTIGTGTWQGSTVGVGYGGTGRTSHTAYALLAGGTTSTGAQQSLSTGTSGQLLASGGSGALPSWASGTSINTSTGAITTTFTSLGGTAPSAGLTLTNSTAAALGAQQVSPSIILSGNGWATGGGGSIATPWQIWALPVQGSSAPTSTLKFQTGIGGTYSDAMTLTSGGVLTLGSTNTATISKDGAGTLLLNSSNSAGSNVYGTLRIVGSSSLLWNTDNVGDIGASGASRPRNLYLGGSLTAPKTVTAAGTTGNQTINKMSGSVNFAAAATSLTVTCNLVTTSSIIICTVGTNDSTMKSVAVVAGSGSFVIYANAAPTAETRVNFLITN